MLGQIRESMLRQMLHVCVANHTKKIQPSDSVVRYDVAYFSSFCRTKCHFRISK